MTRTAGNSMIEALLGLTLVSMALFSLFTLVWMGGQGLMTKRWAAENARCIAQGVDGHTCEFQTCRQLRAYFAIKNCRVKNSQFHGKIQSTVWANLPWSNKYTIKAEYVLYPFEYVRRP